MKEATVQIGDKKVNVAIVNGIRNVRPVLDDIRSGKSKYQFIEVMACPGGCVAGAGTVQPIAKTVKAIQVHQKASTAKHAKESNYKDILSVLEERDHVAPEE